MHGWSNLKSADREIILRGILDGEVHGGPYHVELDPVDTCNVACFFCGSADLHNGKILPWTRLEPLLDELIAGGLRSARLSGGGEATIHPQFGKICDKLAENEIILDELTTNGVLLDRHIDNLLKLQITNIRVSLNYSNKDDYGRFMQTDPVKFEKVIANIELLDRRLREQGRRDKVLIHTQFFVHKGTVDALMEMSALGKELPVDSVLLSAIGGIPQEEVLDAEDLKKFKEALKPFAAPYWSGPWLEIEAGGTGLQNHANSVLAEIRGPSHPQSVFARHEIEYCYIGWYSMTIQGNGDVHPCCFLMQNDAIPSFGNVMEADIAEVWRGDFYRKFRSEMRAAMLSQQEQPPGHETFTCTSWECWRHDICGLAHSMADPAFYKQAHLALNELRQDIAHSPV